MAKQAKNYIDNLKDFNFSVEKLSKSVGYCKEHVNRKFFTAYGVTPKQYFQTIRMGVALDKILSGEKIVNVAEELKYSSPYALSKAFKNHYGLSPENYVLTLSKKI